MARVRFGAVLRLLIRDREGTETGVASDAELLRRFARERDQAAFASLLSRHGPLVWTVCQRMLADDHDAEDAFQATFLVLAAKANSIRRPELLNNWLYGVARRVAHRLKQRQARHVTGQDQIMNTFESAQETSDQSHLRAILDEELDRLPEKYRAPILQCYVEGKTQEQAAAHLGWSAGSVKGRLERGRELLRSRLVRRGVTVSGAALLAALPTAAGAAVPERLLVTTLATSCAFAAGRTADLGVAVVLAQETLRAASGRALILTTLVLASGLIGGSALLGMYQNPKEAPNSAETPPTAVAPAKPSAANPAPEETKQQPVPQDVLDAWKKAGAQLTWMGKVKGAVPPREGRDVDRTRLEGPLTLCAQFVFPGKLDPVVALDKLPDPGVPLFLDLFSTRTTDNQLKELRRFKQLTRLWLLETNVTDRGMTAIKDLDQLQELDLRFTNVSAVGLRELRGLKKLQAFSIGTARMSVGREVTDAELKEITRFEGLTYLTIVGSDHLTDAGLVDIGKLAKLRHLYFSYSPSITEVGLRRVAALENLESLGLSWTSTTDAGLKEIAKLKHLRFLNLNYTRITDAGLRELHNFPQLNILYLAETKLTDTCLKELKKCQSLTQLRLPRGITDAGLAEIKKALPKCKITRYDDNDG